MGEKKADLKAVNFRKNATVSERGKFRQVLASHVNGGCLTQGDVLFSMISSSIPFKSHAEEIILQYQDFKALLPAGGNSLNEIQVEVYSGGNSHVLKMMNYLDKHAGNNLMGAYVHGSLATGEEIAYSDFDALVILKDEVFESPYRLAKVAKKLSDARSIMFDFDPLQHHGWFVLTEADLKYYPEEYFPLELFRYAKSLFSEKGLELTIHIQNSLAGKRKAFDDLTSSIIKRVAPQDYPKNMYQLKGLLSQIMLLPACYVQVRDKKGIYKKYSFAAARVDFLDEDWSIMNEVSSLRENWSCNMSPLRRWLMTRPQPISRFLAKNYAPGIPGSLKKHLTDDFYMRMKNLITAMQRNLN